MTAFLSNTELATLAPSIFAAQPHKDRSSRYSYIPTSTIVDRLRDEGFSPVKVVASRVRHDDKRGFEKHMIRFRPTGGQAARVFGDIFPEVVMVNSHDGSSCYELSAGIFRLACLNGMVVAQGDVDSIKIKHSGGDIVHDVIEGSFNVLGQAQRGIEVAGQWSRLQLTADEQMALAIGVHHVRFADSEGNIDTPITPSQLLGTRRDADRGSDLWKTFNVIQENATKGGLHAISRDPATGRRRKMSTREVKGIDGQMGINRALWKIAEHLANAKMNGTPIVPLQVN